MTALRILISSVQREFAAERAALRDYLRGDPLLRRFFDVFLFEDAPAAARRPDELYLDEVGRCDVYVGLFGRDYGNEDETGVAPTEREFEQATAVGAHRLIFVKALDDGTRHPKMRALIDKAQTGLVRKRFSTPEELTTGLYAALVEYLEARALIHRGPFDAAPCDGAGLDDLDDERMALFMRTARRARGFPLANGTAPADLLAHLNLVKDGRPTNAAVLLFGKAPQRFLIGSEVRCAHFHGAEVEKPIPSYQVYKGTAFELVDQAVDFVLGKIDRAIGTRAESVRAPRIYEVPPEVVTEAIVNAVAHRDYTENGSVQVMLFADRLEVRNPGRLPPALTFDMLRVAHRSIPGNPLLAEPLYLAEYIERMGTGTVDMIRRCAGAGLPEPEFAVTGGFVTTIRRLPPAARVGAGRVGRTVAERETRPERAGAGPRQTPTGEPQGTVGGSTERSESGPGRTPGGELRRPVAGTTTDDPIVAEVRAAREEYAARHGYDIDRIFADLKRRRTETGRTAVRYPPRPAARRRFAGHGPRGFQESVFDGVRIVADGADRFHVLTPFQFDDGDHFVIVLKKDGDGWVLSDQAHTFMHLAPDGDEPDLHEGACAPIVSGILSRFGVEDRGGELVAALPDDGGGDAFYAFVQALIEIQALVRFGEWAQANRAESGVASSAGVDPGRHERREGRR